MQRIDHATAVGSPPTPAAPGTPGYFTEGSPGVTPATVVTDDWLNLVQEELMAIVLAASLTPSKTDSDQVLEAIQLLIGAGSIPGAIGGLGMTMNGSDLLHDIDFAAGAAVSADSTTVLRAAAMTKRLDAAWAAGSGNGGLGNGLSITANTWYHCFVVSKTDGGVDFGFDTSPTAGNLLSSTGGSKYRMIGSLLTKPAATEIIPFTQRGHFFQWTNPPLDVNADIGASESLLTLSSPPDVRAIAKVRAEQEAGTALWLLINATDEANAAPEDVTDGTPAAPGRTLFDNGGASNTLNATLDIYTNTAKQIRARANTAGVHLWLVTIGFEHPRGRW